MMHPAPVRILAVGSCRIFRPLRVLHEAGEVKLLNAAHHWFTHTAASARQYVDVVSGRTVLPPELREMVLETALSLPSELNWEPPEAADVVMVEVSTLKEHRVGRTELNAHKIYGTVKDLVNDYRPVVNGDTSVLPPGHPLKALEVKYTSPAKLLKDLLHVRQRLGVPMLTVNHLYSEAPGGVEPPERAKLTQELRRVEQEAGIPLYDTGILIRKHGTTAALSDQNHYRAAFEPVVAEEMLSMIKKVSSTVRVRPQ